MSISPSSRISTSLSILAFLLALPTQPNAAEPPAAANSQEQPDPRFDWWRDARFGMFVHWGPVSLRGTEIGWSRQGPRRGRAHGGTGTIPVEEYDNLYRTFNPTMFDPDEWCRIAKDAGMRYVVFTSKHHDGFSMFDSKHTDYDIMAGPYGQDICKQLADACHKHSLKLGWYYSPRDWYHPDFATERHDRYLDFYLGQIRELCTNYGQVDVFWFDGLDSPREIWKDTPQKSFELIRKLQPNILLNNRGGLPGDFDTPEQRVGAFNRDRPWETCMTICQQWAWKPNDKLKSLAECLHALVRTVGGDGNFLFNVGPMPDGRIEPRQVERLEQMGAWLRKFGETVYGTRGGPLKPGPFGASTCRDNRVYLHILDWPEETVLLPPLPCEIKRVSVLTGGDATIKQGPDGTTLFIPTDQRDPIDTIIALDLDQSAETITPIDWRIPSGSLAHGKPASASNVFRNRPEFAASKAVDDDPSTRWATDAGTKAAWLEIDLGELRTITRVRIREATQFGQRIQRFQLEYNYVDEWKIATQGTTVGSDFNQSFPSIKARHIRLNILEATEGPTIWELQVFEDNATPRQQTP